MARDDLIQIKGTIVEALAGGNYRVKGDNGMEFLAKIGGRMRRYHIRVIPGDRVTIAVSPYDPVARADRLPRRLKGSRPKLRPTGLQRGVVDVSTRRLRRGVVLHALKAVPARSRRVTAGACIGATIG